jgi:hypothetical protein
MGHRAPSPLCTSIKPAFLPRVRCRHSQCLIHFVTLYPQRPFSPPNGPALTACCGAQAPCSVRQSPLLRHLSGPPGSALDPTSIHTRAVTSPAYSPTAQSHLPRQRLSLHGDVDGMPGLPRRRLPTRALALKVGIRATFLATS